jgi:hypothetical protein
MNMKNYACGFHNQYRQLDWITGFNHAKSSFSIGDIIRSFAMFYLPRRKQSNRRVDLKKANNEQRYISEIPCQITTAVGGHNIWNHDPNPTSLNYELRLLECFYSTIHDF